MNKIYFITGIGTEIGKTLISAILVQKLKADYWKPIQSGDLDFSDTIKVKNLINNKKSIFHPEAYRLTQPYSPHYSAKLDNVEIDLSRFKFPETDNHLIIEGAGGLMVPLNEYHLMIDLIKKLKAEVILVSKNYLGSINHTLLSIEALKNRDIPIKGIIFNGSSSPSTEEIILKMSGIRCLGKIEKLNEIDSKSIIKAGEHISL
ncbi:MAG: dethiobiotin synthase [Bacteroidetes bacterium]|nr:dethiobiotin synthase [Bacteroidota bacterium]MBU1374175.1 dethiobiotin synthase [Bacteroidota bacterium]MBU1484149.1 dethiobiotin synthase [Bacteroidota bacterium]MBU1761607.1 dethiobiotin synthase [Bacteroidota bacterium]MBU2047263.1 dethiobiotin synthase [Bacteroidota bacterium]